AESSAQASSAPPLADSRALATSPAPRSESSISCACVPPAVLCTRRAPVYLPETPRSNPSRSRIPGKFRYPTGVNIPQRPEEPPSQGELVAEPVDGQDVAGLR